MAEAEITAKETRITRGTRAEGEVAFQSSENEFITPNITPEKAFKWFYGNIHIQTQIVNLLPQVFPGEPRIFVEDEDGEPVDDLSVWIAKQAAIAGIYPSMKVSFLDSLSHGCSIKSPGYRNRNGRYEIDEIRDLFSISFRQAPNDALFRGAQNPLMPGIIWDAAEKRIRVYQTDERGTTRNEIKNFSIIRDPMTPFPAGRAYCVPVYQVIGKVDHADHAADQQVNRVGAPLIFPQVVGPMTPDMKTWGDNFVKKWGKDTGFFIPDGIAFPDVKIRESSAARDREEQIIRWIRYFFNPTTILQEGTGTSIGSSDSGASEIWNNYIAGTQAWIEEQYEAFLQPLLTANGYDDVFVRIQLKRPSTDRTGSMLEQLKVGIEGKALLPDDIRRNLPDLDLGEYTPELEAALKAAYAAPAGIFGNLEGFTGKEAKGATQAERKILAANEASLQAIERILQKGGE